MIWAFAAFAALLAGTQDAKGWTPRQIQLIRLSNAAMESDSLALMALCEVQNGRVRYDASLGKLKAMLPQLREELGEYPVYEIFVLRAPRINPAALPPAKCKSLKSVNPERDARMVRYEQAVSALEDGIAHPVADTTAQ